MLFFFNLSSNENTINWWNVVVYHWNDSRQKLQSLIPAWIGNSTCSNQSFYFAEGPLINKQISTLIVYSTSLGWRPFINKVNACSICLRSILYESVLKSSHPYLIKMIISSVLMKEYYFFIERCRFTESLRLFLNLFQNNDWNITMEDWNF